MTTTSRTPVTVVGPGSMGTALAGAFVRAGHPHHTWLDPLHDLLRRAAAAGHADHSISAVTEVLRSRRVPR